MDRVEYARCPYDATPIEAETDWRAPALLSCPTCGAAWEWHNGWLRRLREPDRDAVVRARAAQGPAPIIRTAPDAGLADAMWRQVEPASSDDEDPAPPS